MSISYKRLHELHGGSAGRVILVRYWVTQFVFYDNTQSHAKWMLCYNAKKCVLEQYQENGVNV